MFWFIFLAILLGGIVIACAIASIKEEDFGEAVAIFLIGGAFTGVFTMLLGALCNIIFASIIGYHWQKVDTYQLNALQDGTSMNGSFFLGSGSFDSDPAFFYYEKRDGAYFFKHAHADSSRIIEATGQPRVEVYEQKGDNDLFGRYIWPDKTYKFYVPKGSVVSNYTLDAK